MMTIIHRTRVNHAERLRAVPRALAAGSSIVYIYFNDLNFIGWSLWSTTRNSRNFCFKRNYSSQTSYDDNKMQKKTFLKNCSIPLVQLDPMKAILVFAHQYNTFDKRRLLVNPHPNFVRETKLSKSIY